MRMPGALVVSTVAATDVAAAARPQSSRAKEARNRSTISASPPPGPPLLARETMTSTSPASHVQNPAAARRGKASERAPTCSGTTARARPEQDRDERAVHEADPERPEQLRDGTLVDERVGAVDALGTEHHAEHRARRRGRGGTGRRTAARSPSSRSTSASPPPPRPPRRHAGRRRRRRRRRVRRSRWCQWRCRWCSWVVRIGAVAPGPRRSRRRRDIIGPLRGGPKSVPGGRLNCRPGRRS